MLAFDDEVPPAIAREAARVLDALRLVDTVTGVLGLALALLLAGA